MTGYMIVRVCVDTHHAEHGRVVQRGLTLAQAQAHAKNPATHFRDEQGRLLWWDGYELEPTKGLKSCQPQRRVVS